MQHYFTTQKMKFSSKDFYSKCDQICKMLQIWPHLRKKATWKTSFSVYYFIISRLRAENRKAFGKRFQILFKHEAQM